MTEPDAGQAADERVLAELAALHQRVYALSKQLEAAHASLLLAVQRAERQADQIWRHLPDS